MANRRICIVTGTRAEYGLLFWLMREIQDDPALTLQLIVTGSHLEEKHGMTVDVITKDGFHIDAKVPLSLTEDDAASITRAAGVALGGIGDSLQALQPDIVVVLGDRYEILAAATAAAIGGFPLAHIHGGEITEGAADDSFRHAITKLASYHFPAAASYAARIEQMGEMPESIFVTGTPGLDNIERLPLLDRAETSTALGIDTDTPYFLITMHPTTRTDSSPAHETQCMLNALDQYPDFTLIFTGVNADIGGNAINDAIQNFCRERAARIRMFPSLGQLRYLSAMRHAALIIGNSSSGLLEAPTLRVPTVDIGARQRGRLAAHSVIHCNATQDEITTAVDMALSQTHASKLDGQSPYGGPGASAKIKNILTTITAQRNAAKPFHDIRFQNTVSHMNTSQP